MSKNIVIQKNGSALNFNGATKIRTAAVQGGTEDWVPEDDVELTTLTVTKNGVYKAADRNTYGWSRVTVRVALDYVVGYGSDGNEYYVTSDAQNHIERTKIPSHIDITTPPTVTEYSVGDAIDYSGMVVTLLDRNREVFKNSDYPNGTVPLSELSLPAPTFLGKGLVPVKWLRVDGKYLMDKFRVSEAGA